MLSLELDNVTTADELSRFARNVNTGVSKAGYAPDDESASVTCVHGERVWFASPKGWKAWFCPSKNENEKCPPEFVAKKK